MKLGYDTSQLLVTGRAWGGSCTGVTVHSLANNSSTIRMRRISNSSLIFLLPLFCAMILFKMHQSNFF